MSGWVYIMTNKPRGVLYIGVTSDLAARVWKIELIEVANPGWEDLFARLV